MNHVTSTGYPKIEKIFPLTPGTHLIGGMTETNLTDLLLNMAFQIAKTETPVMFISLTETPTQLCAKLISSELYRQNITEHATYQEIITGKMASSSDMKNILQTIKNEPNLMLLHPNQQITINQLIKLLNEYHKKCQTTPVVMINTLQDLIAPSYDHVLQTLFKWSAAHKDIPIIVHCRTATAFQRHMNATSFGIPQESLQQAATVAGLQFAELCTKEFYGTRDEDGDLHAVPLRKQISLFNDLCHKKTIHLRFTILFGTFQNNFITMDCHPAYAHFTEL